MDKYWYMLTHVERQDSIPAPDECRRAGPAEVLRYSVSRVHGDQRGRTNLLMRLLDFAGVVVAGFPGALLFCTRSAHGGNAQAALARLSSGGVRAHRARRYGRGANLSRH